MVLFFVTALTAASKVQLLLVTRNGSWTHLGRLLATELLRVLIEHGFEFLTCA